MEARHLAKLWEWREHAHRQEREEGAWVWALPVLILLGILFWSLMGIWAWRTFR